MYLFFRITLSLFTIASVFGAGCSKLQSEKSKEEIQVNHALYKAIDSIAKHYVRNLNYSGVVLVADTTRIVLQKAYRSVRISEDTVTAFWIASGTKFMTAVCILRLHQEGKLSENDPIQKYFPALPLDKQGITIRNLLEQTSGLSSSFVSEGIEGREIAVSEILKQELLSPAGRQFNYSNDNYILLAAIIEKVTGESWEKYVKKTILQPAQMNHTGFWGYEHQAQVFIDSINDSIRFQPLFTKIFRNGKPYPNWGQKGATGIFSTTGDLLTMFRSIQSGNILNDSCRQILLHRGFPVSSENDSTLSYGHGCSILKAGTNVYEVRLRGHGDWLHNHQASILSNGYTIITWAKDHGPNQAILGYNLCKDIVAAIRSYK
jgi:CubicO group peptidase (beta-lactamase class C family)